MQKNNKEQKLIRIGMVGSGYMGKAHTVAYKAVRAVFPGALTPVCECISTSSAASAARAAAELGWNRSTGDWRELVADKEIDAIIVASPMDTHKDITLAALAHGKAVFCEKPLGMSAAESLAMVQAAEASGLVHMVGFNYIRTPASQLARQIIESGEIGDIIHVAAEHVEDFMHDASKPMSRPNRIATASPSGALSEVGSHMLNAVLTLAGPIASLVADMNIVYPQRPGPNGPEAVETPDQGNLMVRFASGALGALTFSWLAAGRKMGYTYRVTGTKGSLYFDQENQNELWLYDAGRPAGRQGYQRLLIGPEHPDYLAFNQGPAHGTGYNDQIIIEARDFLQAIANGKPAYPTFRDGYEVDRVIEAAVQSATERRWMSLR